MREKKISAYLDSGSMSLFAEQISEALGNVISIAIHDNDGDLMWAGPGKSAEDSWRVEPFIREPVPGYGYCERLSNRNYAYVFNLHKCGESNRIANLGVQIGAGDCMSLEEAHQEIKPILECIERQIGIGADLSAVRRISSEGRQGMQLLVTLDDLDPRDGTHKLLQRVMRLSADHFAADMVAIVLPGMDIRETWPASIIEDPATSTAVNATLKSLVSTTRNGKQLLVSNINFSTHACKAVSGMEPRILCSPIMNSRDAVVGIFVVMGSLQFSKDQVRLARAISSKISCLTRLAGKLADDHMSRHAFLGHVASVLRRMPDDNHALVYLDIDKLHVVNDSYGHMAGDLVIRTLSDIIDELCGVDDAVAHLNGDNFALFLRNCREKQALQKANMIIDALNTADISFDGRHLSVTASLGIALIPEVVADAAAAVNTAELAARSAKARGGNRVVVFRDLDASVVQRRSDLDQVHGLQLAIIENRFELHAQPIEALCEEDVRQRYEILLRMTDESGQMLPPGRFLSAAERYQMMPTLDRWVVRNALGKLGDSDNILEISMSSFSINVSPQSLADDDFIVFLEERIAESGVSPDALCFEITESAVVKNLDRAQRFIRRLRKLGCRLALDDFGTGYCSFAYLKDLPVQYIKVDGVFVRDILENPLSEAIVSSLSDIAKVMHASTVAEHVETELVMQRLRQLNIDFVQGFVIGRPRPLGAVLDELGNVPALTETSVLEQGAV